VRPAIVFLVLLLLPVASAAAQSEESAAQELFRLTNEARAQQGLDPLEWDERLAQIAAAHAEQMASHNQLSHQFPGEPTVRQRVISTGMRSNTSGENVGFAATVDGIHDGWMNSPGHRRNILDARFNAIGIGVVRNGPRVWAVQDLARRLPDTSLREVESIVATTFSRVRAERHLSPLSLVDAPNIRREACDMAERDSVSADIVAHRLTNIRSVFTFTASEPQKLPDGLTDSPPAAARSFAVGACFRKTDRYPEGTNWIVVAFF